MGEFDVLMMMVMVSVGLQLLHQASQKLRLSRWLTPLSVGWVISGLLWLMPAAEQGGKGAIAVSYLLVGTLILNTLALYLCSRLPDHLIPIKSAEIELIGGTLLNLLGTGMREVGRSMLIALFEIIDSILFPQQSKLTQLNAG
jgi:hypothetical protein